MSGPQLRRTATFLAEARKETGHLHALPGSFYESPGWPACCSGTLELDPEWESVTFFEGTEIDTLPSDLCPRCVRLLTKKF